MANPGFTPQDIGICLSTLFADPWGGFEEAELEQALELCGEIRFPEISLGPAHVQTLGIDRLRQLFNETSTRARVIEALTAWTNGPEEATGEARNIIEMAAALGADTLLAATIAPTIDTVRAAEGMAAACELAGNHGLRIAIEFIPGTALPDLATAWTLAQSADPTSAGLVIDMLHWHHQPGGPDFDQLRAIPAERIYGLQVCDSPPGATPEGEQYIPFAMTARALPGEGVVAIDALLAALTEMGVDPYVALEVYNKELAGQGMDAMARRLRQAVDAVFQPH